MTKSKSESEIGTDNACRRDKRQPNEKEGFSDGVMFGVCRPTYGVPIWSCLHFPKRKGGRSICGQDVQGEEGERGKISTRVRRQKWLQALLWDFQSKRIDVLIRCQKLGKVETRRRERRVECWDKKRLRTDKETREIDASSGQARQGKDRAEQSRIHTYEYVMVMYGARRACHVMYVQAGQGETQSGAQHNNIQHDDNTEQDRR